MPLISELLLRKTPVRLKMFQWSHKVHLNGSLQYVMSCILYVYDGPKTVYSVTVHVYLAKSIMHSLQIVPDVVFCHDIINPAEDVDLFAIYSHSVSPVELFGLWRWWQSSGGCSWCGY